MWDLHSGYNNSMSIKLGPAAESIVKMCGCKMQPVAIIYELTPDGFAWNKSAESHFLNGISVS